MENNELKDLLLKLQNIYQQFKSNKDKRLLKPIIKELEELTND